MSSESLKRTFIFLMLGLLTVSAFFIRLDNFKNSSLRSIDEIVYYRMAKQVLTEGLSGYHTIPYGEEMAASGRPLPEYFSQPLFKHPPLFTFLAVLSMKLFGDSIVSAGYVSLALSALMIPLIYLLGTLIFDRRVGILSALFLWMDPVSIICSQKIWMGATIAFFDLLAIVAFIYALKTDKQYYFIVFGLFCGLATITKLTGLLPVIAAVVYVLCYQRSLLRNKFYFSGLLIPLLFLIPWIFWNFSVYGPGWVYQSIVKHHPHVLQIFQSIDPVVGLSALIILSASMRLIYKFSEYLTKRKKSIYQNESLRGQRIFVGTLICTALCILFFKQLSSSFQYHILPGTSWGNFSFRGDNSPLFYFQQLINFFPLYIFAFFAILFQQEKNNDRLIFIRLSAVVSLSFFIIWGNYQSRYIVAVIPMLVVLAVDQILVLLKGCSCMRRDIPRILCKAALLIFIINGLLKTLYINKVLSFPHDFCYF